MLAALPDLSAATIRRRAAFTAVSALGLLGLAAAGLWLCSAGRPVPKRLTAASATAVPSIAIPLTPAPAAPLSGTRDTAAAPAAAALPPDLVDKARAGDPDAQHALAVALAEGRGGLPRDPERAAQWFREAAINGVADAQYRLGLLYLERPGPRGDDAAAADDTAEALIWLQTAADRQHADAQYALAQLYRDGRRGIPADAAESERWLRRAAALGHAAAARDLAAMLLDRSDGRSGGSGDNARSPAAADEIEAFAWYDRAAAAGDAEAAVARDRLAASLPPERRAAAEARSAALAAEPETAPARGLVLEIQRQLAAAGYDPGPVDGRLGDRTVEAIRDYQSDNHIVPDGHADDDLLARLKATVLRAPPTAN